MRKPTSYRDAMLREMGLGPIWRLRSASAGDDETSMEEVPAAVEQVGRSVSGAVAAVAEYLTGADVGTAPVRPRPAAQAGVPAAPVRERRPVYETFPAQPVVVRENSRVAAAPDPERTARISTLDWDALEADIRGCRACVLCEQRKQAVPGVGDRQADWMFVGEGPGREEDQRGEPFVGQAGRLLDNMLAALDLERGKNVYIANAVKCRPPHNRTPEPAEIGDCLPYLERQVELVKPRLLVALGRPAAQALLNTEISISKARGRTFGFKGIPVIVSYHPAYLLRNPQDKGKAWADLCFARRLMAEQAQKG
ncbi:uracil-DNA glycosylase [Thauera linaloolentis]|uniref:Type-4 uracil-DNA glycosylase n=1 Tax=Thauera linaloolentis (strain DSM 12138 / JCM 21573 / CCUG 41526 / CIP 105981 / IAM 15112 / NBRC 102519 / 47Lol) TaxID=1123367 RepID=N6YUS1_THAL4|nr:uracil-DNA glycosylase [Thauera linaloolentis]ENO85878.1 phage DNA polymerase-like protein [Thauera linaloolentis 47Lol = DSM 12138]MCM8567625.1 uracil-DNA glycosylase [Thauera linaloolentis]